GVYAPGPAAQAGPGTGDRGPGVVSMTALPRSQVPGPRSRLPLFSHQIRVYWEDTDAGGVVYHAQYLAFLERARSEWLRSLGRGQDALRREHDLVFAVRAMQVDFRAPARLDDALQVSCVLR